MKSNGTSQKKNKNKNFRAEINKSYLPPLKTVSAQQLIVLLFASLLGHPPTQTSFFYFDYLLGNHFILSDRTKNGGLAHFVMVSKIQWKPFSLPASSIHKMTGLGGEMVWTMTYAHAPHHLLKQGISLLRWSFSRRFCLLLNFMKNAKIASPRAFFLSNFTAFETQHNSQSSYPCCWI